jgi:microcystin-dependent protein
MSVNKVNSDGSLKRIAGGTLYADAPLGTILAFGGTSAPAGWMLCQGQALSRTTYAKLFAIIGTAFGTGDGSTTFNIPDLRGEFLRGAGTNSHSGQGNGGSVGTHQDATGIDSFITEQTTHRLVAGYGAQNRNSTINADASTRSGLTGCAYQKVEQSITDVYVDRCFVRPTNTSVNYIIKAKMVALPADLQEGLEEALEPITAVIPSDASSSNKLATNAFAGKGANMTRLTGTTDLDDVTTEGWYFSDGADSLVNKPFTGCYNNILHVQIQGTTGRILQTLYCHNVNAYYFRQKAGGTWSEWHGTNNNYSTGEIFTGKTWIDGKPIYRKVIECGYGPNGTTSTTKSVPHNISNLGDVISISGFCKGDSGAYLPFPYEPTNLNTKDGLAVYISNGNVVATTLGFNFNTYKIYAILEYTKTT